MITIVKCIIITNSSNITFTNFEIIIITFAFEFGAAVVASSCCCLVVAGSNTNPDYSKTTMDINFNNIN